MTAHFDVDYIIASAPALVDGLGMTVLVSALSIVLAAVVGGIGAALRLFDVPVLSRLVEAYVALIRNTPLLTQLFFIFYGLPTIGLKLSPFWSGALALTVWGGAYNTENLRGGFLGVPKGLNEAALSLGLRPLQFLALIALPMALRISIPAMLNTAVSVLKNSAYLQAIGLAELTFVAMERVASEFRTLEMFAAIGAIYLGVVLVLSWLVRRIEHRLQQPFHSA